MDDNIRCLKEICENHYTSIFDHPYLAMYRRLHQKFGLKIQLNLFYRTDGFDLSQMSDAYYGEWRSNADWLKLSFHSDRGIAGPYEGADYREVYEDCRRVNEQIVRFASAEALAKTTTIHYCLLTEAGLQAMEDNGVSGLLGLFGTAEEPRTSYGLREGEAEGIRGGEILRRGSTAFASIDVVLNCFEKAQIIDRLARMRHRDGIRVMIHEQYFYGDYPRYQPNFEEKLVATFSFLRENGYQSFFFEELI